MTSRLRRSRRHILSAFATLVAFALAIVTIIPFLWMFDSSFAPTSVILGDADSLFPRPTTRDNYANIQSQFDFGRLFVNSFVVSSIRTVLIVYISALFGFVFAKFRFRGRDAVFVLLIATMMVPWPVLMLPLSDMMIRFQWVDTYVALIVPELVSAAGIFLFRQAMRAVPDQLLDSARIDGAGDARIFHSIMLPMCRNTVCALAILTFLASWDAYLWPYLMITNPRKQMLAVGLQQFSNQHGTDYGGMFAATSLAVLPMVVIYALFQRRFIEGMYDSVN
ncbi:sugar ABC transporter permease [Bifidobacterium italicum]|uniref:Sugar ABC transporter permease n=1 Tax=Bifidobacterium italicum TaxID=1960968 RepID=A0A2A2EK39_9BIFI|nr:carbohydrate ABC transporter permease [Bifidobacterium italicum]PAU69310.1 sugar ABC transporter permease [Bifidobacterium italicum]